MIEALIDVQCMNRGEKALGLDCDAQGDVIACKLPGAPWGTKELSRYCVVIIDDEAIETELRRQAVEGEACPVVIYPYSERDKSGKVIRRSTVRVAVDKLVNYEMLAEESITVPPFAIDPVMIESKEARLADGSIDR